MLLEPNNDGRVSIHLADAGNVGAHSQQVGITALQLWGGAPSAAVVLQKQPQALQTLTCALKQSRCLVCLAQQPLHQKLAPLKSSLEAVDRACTKYTYRILYTMKPNPDFSVVGCYGMACIAWRQHMGVRLVELLHQLTACACRRESVLAGLQA